MNRRIEPVRALLSCLAGFAGIALFAPSLGAASAPEPVPADPGCYAGPGLDAVIPGPRQARYSAERIMLWAPGVSAPRVCLVVAPSAPAPVHLAAAEFMNRLQWLARRAGAVNPASRRPRVPVVPALARAAEFAVAIAFRVDPALPREIGPEGYRITWNRRAGQVRITCSGRDPRGVYYAGESLQQLCGVRNRAIRLRLANIADWPAYRIRCTGNDGSIPAPDVCRRAVTWLPRFKFNAWAVGESYLWHKDWRHIPVKRLHGLEAACKIAAKNGVLDVIFQIHPFRGRSVDKQYNMVISNPKDVDAFTTLCEHMLDAGARGILFRADDYHPLSPQDQARFGGKAQAHIFLIRELDRRIRKKHPHCLLIFCPPYYQGNTARSRPEFRRYMQALARGVPPEVAIMWTGPVTRSLTITHRDIAAYKSLIGRDPFLWDNTVYAHRGRFGYDPRRPGYLFDPFETKYPSDYPQTCPGIRYNWGYADSAVSKTANITVADYLWNPVRYDPGQALRRALAAVYGPAAVQPLLALRDAVYAIRDTLDAHRSMDPAAFRAMAQADQDIPRILERLQHARISPDKFRELRDRAVQARRRFARLEAKLETVRRIRNSALVRFHFSGNRWKTETRGKWTVEKTEDSVGFAFPIHTPSKAGTFGAIHAVLSLPPAAQDQAYLVFSVFDDYDASGTPPRAWPGYLRKQVLVNGKIVWDDDVEGREPLNQESMQVVDLRPFVRPGKPFRLTFRGFDRRGVHNMGARIRFAGACISPGPFRLAAWSAEIPDCPALHPGAAFAVAARFLPGPFGKRRFLYAKTPPFQYFAYQHESGHIVAGVFAGRKEVSLQTQEKVIPGRENTLLFVYDHGDVRLFLNGKAQGRTRTGAPLAPGTGPLRLAAASAAGPYYDGTLRELRIFRKPVLPTDLATISRENLAGWWKPTPAMIVARDLAGRCPDGAVYRTWVYGPRPPGK